MKTYYHVIEEGENIGTHGFFANQDEAQKEANRLQDFFPKLYFYVYSSNSKKEPQTGQGSGNSKSNS